jgi:hypothetical protein
MNLKYKILVEELNTKIAEIKEHNGLTTVILLDRWQPSSKMSIESVDYITFTGRDITSFVELNSTVNNVVAYAAKLEAILQEYPSGHAVVTYTYSKNTKFKIMQK